MDIKELNFVRRMINRFLHTMARFVPGSRTIRPFLHRLRGVKIHGHVFIGEEVYIENNYPHAVEIHEDVSITLRATIMAHFRGPGKVIIEKKAWIGPNSFIGASTGQILTIGEGAVLGASSVVTKDVAPYTMVVGMQARPFAKVTVPFTREKSYEEITAGLIRLDDED